jgi:hypothetical protein
MGSHDRGSLAGQAIIAAGGCRSSVRHFKEGRRSDLLPTALPRPSAPNRTWDSSRAGHAADQYSWHDTGEGAGRSFESSERPTSRAMLVDCKNRCRASKRTIATSSSVRRKAGGCGARWKRGRRTCGRTVWLYVIEASSVVPRNYVGEELVQLLLVVGHGFV